MLLMLIHYILVTTRMDDGIAKKLPVAKAVKLCKRAKH